MRRTGNQVDIQRIYFANSKYSPLPAWVSGRGGKSLPPSGNFLSGGSDQDKSLFIREIRPEIGLFSRLAGAF
jgi:hypothetical protein